MQCSSNCFQKFVKASQRLAVRFHEIQNIDQNIRNAGL